MEKNIGIEKNAGKVRKRKKTDFSLEHLPLFHRTILRCQEKIKTFCYFLSFQNLLLDNIFLRKNFFHALIFFRIAINFVLKRVLFFLFYVWLFSSYSGKKIGAWKNLQKNWALSRSSLFFCILSNYRKLIIASRNLSITHNEVYFRYVFLNTVFSNNMESTRSIIFM